MFALWAVIRYDWLRLTSPAQRVLGEVIRHRTGIDGDGESFAAIYRFTDETGPHEVIDQVYTARLRPAVGSRIELVYPQGRPDLARPPRPMLWLFIYTMLTGMLALLIAKALGWLD